MPTTTSITRIVAVTLLLAGLAPPAGAGDFRAKVELEHVGKHTVPVEAAGAEKIVHGAMTGQVTSASDESLVGASDLKTWTVVVTSDGQPNLVGTDSLETSDGSVLHVRYDGVPSFATDDGVGRGSWSVLGGLGKYADASGGGEFTFRSTDTGGVKVLEGELDH